ncbi:MAG: Ig-like domain-containing protein [Clostridia bacterium]|nr:Ig-like domain-containing protein [Clostridia bacterium]
MSKLMTQLTRVILTLAVCTVLTCSLCFAAPESGFASGDGSSLDPFVIENVEQLEYFAASVNGGNSYSGMFILLGADIFLCDTDDSDWASRAPVWQSIGSAEYPFAGSFDGGGHTVSGMYIDGGEYSGFFGYSRGDIRNLNVGTSQISGGRYIGGLCAYSESGIIMDCFSSAEITAGADTLYTGGICGYNKGGAVINCVNMGTIRGVSDIGGICGASHDTVYNCTNSGSITSTGDHIGGICGWSYYSISGGTNESAVLGKNYVGGVCGVNFGNITESRSTNTILGISYTAGVCGYSLPNAKITNSYNTGKVSGTGYIGGVCGMTYASVSDCYNTAQISGYKNVGGVTGAGRDITESYNVGAVSGSSNIGGICGENYSSLVSVCYNLGTVSGVEYTGGISGYNYSIIMDCYNAGQIIGTTLAGGICGRNAGGVVSTCYSASSVEAQYFAGALIGSNSPDGVVQYNYYLAETAIDGSKTVQKGIGSGAAGQYCDDTAGQTTALTVAKMKLADSFTGFDFDTVWTIKGNETYLYPELRYASYVSGITLDKKELTFTEYKQSAKLTVTIPFNLTLNTRVEWTSSNEQAVTVDQNGLVTAVGTGRAIVMASLSDGSFFASCNVSAVVPELTVGASGGKPGATIRLDLTAANNPGFDTVSFKLNYNTDNLALESIESELLTLLEGNVLSYTGQDAYTDSGKLAVLVFRIKDATAIATSAIRLEVTACTKNGETVTWKITNGEIKITGFDRGDINKDGKLDGEDAVALLRHLNTTEPLPDTSMCDVNHDGKINIRDVICLVNHLNGTAPFEPEDTTQEHE